MIRAGGVVTRREARAIGRLKHFGIVAVVGLAVTFGVTPAVAAASGWLVQETFNPVGTGPNLKSVSCTSSTACTAVGSYFSSETKPLAERWNGTSWVAQTVPAPEGSKSGVAIAVSCASSTFCTLVGEYESLTPLVEHWNGTSWTIQVTPKLENVVLKGISCPTVSSCTAVGYQQPANKSENPVRPVVEHWNGSAWTIQETPKLLHGELLGVSCTSASACTATGLLGNAALVERWNGTTWAVQETPEIAGAIHVALDAVSCTNVCIATGTSDENTLAERWDGISWTVLVTPNPTGGKHNELLAVSCMSKSCTATGRYFTPGKIYAVTLAEYWNGGTWTIQETPAPENQLPEGGSGLKGVSCTSATACEAVGSYLESTGKEVTLGEVHS
jgi:hypothetical protein